MQSGVLSVDMLHTRMFGDKIYVDLEIGIDGNKTLFEAHAIADDLHNAVEKAYPQIKHIMIHTNPY
jgi:divalent metal cation (Fe/Co/Zn/Cd) transporter